MYKVFFNDREINITVPENITIIKPAKIIHHLTSVKEVEKWFLEFKESSVVRVFIAVSSPEFFFETLFMPAFKMIKAAGGVVLRNNKILFILRNGVWDLPKGKTDRGETNREAALREVEEECGIFGHSIVKQLQSTYHIYQSPYKESRGKWILKETFWFEMSYLSAENGEPETEENITELRWFSKNELDIVLKNTYENLKQIIMLYRD